MNSRCELEPSVQSDYVRVRGPSPKPDHKSHPWAQVSPTAALLSHNGSHVGLCALSAQRAAFVLTATR